MRTLSLFSCSCQNADIVTAVSLNNPFESNMLWNKREKMTCECMPPLPPHTDPPYCCSSQQPTFPFLFPSSFASSCLTGLDDKSSSGSLSTSRAETCQVTLCSHGLIYTAVQHNACEDAHLSLQTSANARRFFLYLCIIEFG